LPVNLKSHVTCLKVSLMKT